MSAFDIESSIKRAQARLGQSPPYRRTRSDIGTFRLHPDVNEQLAILLGGQERIPQREVTSRLETFCSEKGLQCPSRATIYKYMARVVVHKHDLRALPSEVRQTLYNLADDILVPGHQLAFHCFNYGGLRALSYAASLPWLSLYQAVRMRGWRTKSRGPLLAVCRARGI